MNHFSLGKEIFFDLKEGGEEEGHHHKGFEFFGVNRLHIHHFIITKNCRTQQYLL